MQHSDKTDPRVQRTRATICNAFVNLLEVKDFHAVSTTEIIKAAGVNRNTFYKYYRSKNDLAAQLSAHIANEFRRILADFFRRDFSLHDTEADRSLFRQRRLVLALWNINTRRCHLYQDMLDIAAESFIQHMHSRHLNHADKDRSYQSRMFAGIVLSSTAYYFKQNQPIPTTSALLELKEMTAILCQEDRDKS